MSSSVNILKHINEFIDDNLTQETDIDIDRSDIQQIVPYFLNMYQKQNQKCLLQAEYLNRYKKDKQQHLTTLDSQIMNQKSKYQELQYQRNKIQNSLYNKELELQQIEKKIGSQVNVGENNIHQKLNDLLDGFSICQERCDQLQEENQELHKNFNYQKSANISLTNILDQIQNKSLEQSNQLTILEENGAKINQQLMKKLKIVNDLRLFIKSQKVEQQKQQQPQGGQTPSNKCKRKDQWRSKLFSYEDSQYLEDSFSNFDSLHTSIDQQQISRKFIQIENDLADYLGHIITLKNELASITIEEQELKSQSSKKQGPIIKSLSFTTRNRTHQDLGKKNTKLDQNYKRLDTIKAFTENSDDENNNEFQQGQGERIATNEDYIVDTPRKPWYYKSAVAMGYNKGINSEKINDIRNFHKGFSKTISFNSLASFSSLSSNKKFGAPTLREELTMLQNKECMTARDRTSDTSKKQQFELGDFKYFASGKHNHKHKYSRISNDNIETPQVQMLSFSKYIPIGIGIGLGIGSFLCYKMYMKKS